MKVAVYPGSFDPLHIGHLAVMQALTEAAGFDRVYLVISPQNPFKEPEKALNARRRYEDAVAAVARHPELKVSVDGIELGIPPPNYTIKTLDALRRREPGNSFALVMGADNLAKLPSWRCSRRLLSEYDIMVYPRPGYDAEALMEGLRSWCRGAHARSGGIRLLDAPLVDISSTEIRTALASGEDASRWLM